MEEIDSKRAYFLIEHHTEWMSCDKITVDNSNGIITIQIHKLHIENNEKEKN